MWTPVCKAIGKNALAPENLGWRLENVVYIENHPHCFRFGMAVAVVAVVAIKNKRNKIAKSIARVVLATIPRAGSLRTKIVGVAAYGAS